MSGVVVMRWEPPLAADRPFVVLLPAQIGDGPKGWAGWGEPPTPRLVNHFQSLDELMEFVMELLPEGHEPSSVWGRRSKVEISLTVEKAKKKGEI